ncbi:MAG TPA: HD-GYP domain-containing protein [Longimicrobiales bacterium]|nr:HD-GYP domain-containing protein [Longimicrobiales bacterium]
MDQALFEMSHEDRMRLCYESMREKDALTAAHCSRVAVVVERLAGVLGADGDTLDLLRSAALVHDVGKAAIPQSILTKPAPLDAAEWQVMKQHPEVGARLARKLELPDELCDVVMHHHERYDGTGYPHGLSGDAIPLGARVLTVVDVFDAMTSERCYRPAFTMDAALHAMAQESGTVLDPDVLRGFEGMLRGETRARIRVLQGVG